MSNVVVRPVVLTDLGRITEIYADAVLSGTASYELEPPSLAEMTGRFTVLKPGGFPYLVAEAEGTVAGYAYAGPFRPRPAYRFIVEDSIYVAPEAQGRGIGRVLMERLIEDVRLGGYRQIVAVIGDGSPESASVRLHERLGFRHSGVLEGSGYKHGRWLDTVFMQLPLNGGTSLPPNPESVPERRFRGGV
ncbi:N-acetyltransferase [Pseudaminobacter sp. 19-2017]|uniref:N-acetyltransferase n=1 Tax=Pseudaminobacter soli (ex Zhang et al. 2022) TaxID=2831468 RepID=A0A942DYQ9_9HYPH|nr:GNAT family N-acetyltransferase [Pseudaminobacter soli]MBS3647963.1 N-acetyltransferase [Pseudaminobacter soli]